jgi:hypothetical protein
VGVYSTSVCPTVHNESLFNRSSLFFGSLIPPEFD